jgi:hypothetical protein
MGKVVEYGGVCFESSWPNRPALAENGNIDQSHVTCILYGDISERLHRAHICDFHGEGVVRRE